jgi:hypothetical protein
MVSLVGLDALYVVVAVQHGAIVVAHVDSAYLGDYI